MSIRSLFLRLAIYSVLLAGAYYVSLVNVANGVTTDRYFSEVPQNLLLFGIIGVSFGVARRTEAGRTINRCIGIFFTACLIREFDNELDALFYKGAWKVPAIPVGLLLLYYVIRRWTTLLVELRRLGDSLATGILALGLVLLMVFSRLWGSNDMWRHLMPGEYNRHLVRVSEEGIELMAYTVIFIGVLEMALKCVGRQQRARPACVSRQHSPMWR